MSNHYFNIGDEVITIKEYTGKPVEGKITKLRNYKYLGLVATIKPKNGGKKQAVCVVCLDFTPERKALEEL